MSEPIRVTMIISRFSPSIGGTERQALLLSKELIRRGLNVEVLTQRYSDDLSTEEMIEGIAVHRLAPTGHSLLASALFLLNGLRYLMKHPPQILHAHMLATPAVLASWARRLGGGPAIVKLACSGSYGEMAVGRSSWLGRRKLATVLSTANRLICVSQDLVKEVRTAGVSENRVVQIPNGVDTDEFSPAAEHDTKNALRKSLGLEDAIWILFAGRLTRQKRPDLVLNAFLKSAERRSNLYLLMVGEGDDQAALMEQAKKTPEGSRVRWVGRQSEMAVYYKAADIFVLPSEAEGMSNSLLEAMSSGLACIVSRTAMAEEMLNDSQACLVPSGDMDALSKAMNRLADGETLRNTLGRAARANVQSRYSIQAVADRYVDLYTRLTSPTQEAA